MFLFYHDKNDVYRDLAFILGGFLRGINYGVKIRLPHAFVTTFLFRSGGTIKDKLQWILTATKQHAWNLSRFVLIYKLIMTLLFRTRMMKRNQKGKVNSYSSNENTNIVNMIDKQPSWHSFIAGSIGGYLIFSKDDNINNQVSDIFSLLITLLYFTLFI